MFGIGHRNILCKYYFVFLSLHIVILITQHKNHINKIHLEPALPRNIDRVCLALHEIAKSRNIIVIPIN
jgi:hypothetical protein